MSGGESFGLARSGVVVGTVWWLGTLLLLPLPLSIKQSMLEINDAGIRLDVLSQFLAKQGLI